MKMPGFPVLSNTIISRFSQRAFGAAVGAVVVGLVVVDSQAKALAVFDFESGVQGWSNQPSEPFMVQFAPGAGVGGGGSLLVSGAARDSWQLIHAYDDPGWTSVSGFYQFAFDIKLLDVAVGLAPSRTGFKIRSDATNASTAYLASDVIDIGQGWTRITLKATTQSALPQSRDDIGLNWHIGTTFNGGNTTSFYLDNLTATVVPGVPGPLPAIGLAVAFGFSRKLKKRIKASTKTSHNTQGS
jgi:hypothetical protein